MRRLIRDYFTVPYRVLAWLVLASWAVLGLTAFGVTRALAADVAVTWTQPTTNTDGSAIPATGPGSIASNRIEWGTCNGTAFGTKVGERVVSPVATSATVTGLGPATWCFRVYATNTYAQESAASNAAQRVVNPPTPNPPVVTQATIARLWRHGVQREVGRVALNVPCGTLKYDGRKADWHTVPRETVALNRRGQRLPSSAVIVAKCGVG